MACCVLKDRRVLSQTLNLSTRVGLRRGVAALAALAATLGLVGAAHAQNVTIGTNVTRTVSKRSADQYPLYISYADCVSEDEFLFPVNLTNLSTPSQITSIEVWLTEGGTNDCSLYASRAGLVPVCTLVHQEAAGQQRSTTIRIPSSEVANALTDSGCDDKGANTVPREVRIYFLAIRSSTVASDVPATDSVVFDKTKVDLLGPTAPTGIKVGIGDDSLTVSYTPSTEKDTIGYKYFCDDGSGAAAAGSGGGGGGAVGAGGSASSDGSCPSSALVPGQLPDLSTICGSSRSPSGVAKASNGTLTTVGVSAFDSVGNVGKLSTLVCGTPNPVDDFFTKYREAGGQAGGGWCSLGAAPPSSLFGLGVAGSALVFFARRRRAARRKGDA